MTENQSNADNGRFFSIRNMQPEDLPVAMELLIQVGWNQTERDLWLFLERGKSTYLVAEVDDQVVGMVASIHYGIEVAWISMMIVREAFRGRGISKWLLNTQIRQLKEQGVKTIKLDATPAGRPVYRKLGFEDEYAIHRYVHPGWTGLTEKDFTAGEGVTRPLLPTDLPQTIILDRIAFGAERTLLLNRLMEENKGYVVEKDHQIVAYALGRQGRRFFQIGPLIGNNWMEAQQLIGYICNEVAGQPIAIDVLADKTLLIEWLESLGFVFQRPLFRMFLVQNAAPGQPHRQYCIAGPEFG